MDELRLGTCELLDKAHNNPHQEYSNCIRWCPIAAPSKQPTVGTQDDPLRSLVDEMRAEVKAKSTGRIYGRRIKAPLLHESATNYWADRLDWILQRREASRSLAAPATLDLAKRGFNDGIECAARKIEVVMERSPKHDRELLAKSIRGLALAAAPSGTASGPREALASVIKAFDEFSPYFKLPDHIPYNNLRHAVEAARGSRPGRAGVKLVSYTACVFENGKCKYCGKDQERARRDGYAGDMCGSPELNPDSYEAEQLRELRKRKS